MQPWRVVTQASCRSYWVDTLLKRHSELMQHWQVTGQGCIHASWQKGHGALKHYAALQVLMSGVAEVIVQGRA